MRLCDFLAERGLCLTEGVHSEESPDVCVLEAVSLYRGVTKTDVPEALGTWDLRPLNDMAVPVTVRTDRMCRLADIYEHCRAWPVARQLAVVDRIVIDTVRRVKDLMPARMSTWDAAAARMSAAWAAKSAATEAVFVSATQIWIDAAEVDE